MTDIQSDATTLCKACGLCCTGHLFAWAKLRASEMESAKALGLKVLGTDPKSRGFVQPCPLWEGECTIYTSPQYPHFCGLYKCKLLKSMLDDTTPLGEALDIVQDAKKMIDELEAYMPVSPNNNFRERLIARMEQDQDPAFQQKARALLLMYRDHFGVKDLVDDLEEIDV